MAGGGWTWQGPMCGLQRCGRNAKCEPTPWLWGAAGHTASRLQARIRALSNMGARPRRRRIQLREDTVPPLWGWRIHQHPPRCTAPVSGKARRGGPALDGRRGGHVAHRTKGPRIDPRELGAQQENLRRVVDPHRHHDQRARCSTARSQVAFADADADQEAPACRWQRSHRCAQPDPAPLDRNRGMILRILANTTVVISKPMARLKTCASRANSPKAPDQRRPSADNAALAPATP